MLSQISFTSRLRKGRATSMSEISGWTPGRLIEAVAAVRGRAHASKNIFSAAHPSPLVLAASRKINPSLPREVYL